MDKESLAAICLSLPDTYIDYPFGATTEVFKIKPKGKMFAYMDYAAADKIKRNCGTDSPVSDGDLVITLKCPPALCEIFRANYKAVIPGYYANKAHWNTVITDKDVPIDILTKMIEQSYELVAGKGVK